MKSKKVVQYRPSLVTYVDILGFKNIISNHTAGQVSRLLRITTRGAKSWLPFFRTFYKTAWQNFSDLSVRVTRLPEHAAVDRRIPLLAIEITALTYLQEALVYQRVLVRGAVTAGDIVKSWGLFYGPCLIRAYELEKQAVFPRIILDPQMIELFRPGNTSGSFRFLGDIFTHMLREDRDGVTFIDYLRAADKYLPDGGFTPPLGPRPEYLGLLQSHKQLVEDGLRTHTHNYGIYSKFEWLKAYHNDVVQSRQLSASMTNELLVTLT